MRQELHGLLKKQLKQHFNGSKNMSEEFNGLLQVINESYIKFEKDFENLEISLNKSTKKKTEEVKKVNENLKREIEERKRIEIKLIENVKRISKLSKYEAIISSITQSVHQSVELRDVLEYAVDSISKNIESVKHVTIYFVENDFAVMQTHRGFTKEYIRKASKIPKGKGLIWKTIIEKKPLFVLDTQKDDVIGPAGKKMGIMSYISIPLFNDKSPIGVLALTSSDVHGFSEDDFGVAEMLAQQIQSAMDNANRLVQISIKSRYESIISSIVQSVHKSIELDEVLDNAVDALKSNIEQCSHVSISLVEDEIAVMKAFRGYEKEKSFTSVVKSIPKPKGFIWKTILEGKTINCRDIDKDGAIDPAGRKTGSKSYVCVPLVVYKEIVGTLNLHSKEVNAFNDDEIKLLEDVSNQISVAINNAKKAKELDRKNTDLEKKNRYENIINSITRSVHKSIYLEDVLDNAADALSKNVDSVKHVNIYMVEGKSAVLKAHRGLTKKYIEIAGTIPYGKGLTWKTINDGEARYVANTDQDEFIGDAGKKMGIKSYLSVPLYNENVVVGTLTLTSSVEDAFKEDELNLLETVSQQIQSAIDNAQKAEALFRSEEHNRLLIDNVKDYAIIMLDVDGFVESWNSGAERLTGYKENEIVGKVFSTFYFKDDVEKEIPTQGLKIASHENSCEHDIWIIKKDRTSFWANVLINAIRDVDGDLIGYTVAMHDITEKKIAAEELEAYAAKLERSNEELEQFAYVASHDLQEPLRMVGSYLGLLEMRYSDKLDKDAKDFIYYAVDGAKRMQVLINDLLTYSRVSTRGKPFEIVDFKQLVDGVLKNLEIAIQESGMEITCEGLPEKIVVDPIQMSQLLQNLFGNAIKFCKNRMPKIKLKVEDKLSEWQFSVKDNGIGIEPEYFERIFVIFQRLHGKTDYAGTGIGLAICKKIVLRHEGDIWVESEPGHGSTFYFTIPKRGGN